MNKYILLMLAMSTLCACRPPQEREVKLKIVQTSDLHGNYYPYDFIRRTDAKGSLSRVASYVKEQRNVYGDNLILLENGDILQGQPTAYYYNFIDTLAPHLTADMLNYLEFDAGNMGNHDIETGRSVFNRWSSQCQFPVLGANIIEVESGETHCPPYVVLERDGVKVAVLGMITPAIPVWLSENLWKGLRFDDMEETARKWVGIIRERENPDLLVGLFHAGKNPQLMADKYWDNASLEVARKVPGFDVVLIGHDHTRACMKVANVEGDSVLVLNPASNGLLVSDVEITVRKQGDHLLEKHVDGKLVETDAYAPDADFLTRFAEEQETVRSFVSKPIGTFSQTISTRPAYFGSSAFVDLIHTLQLEISNAEISLAAPLSFDAEIRQGEIFVSDMFNLYKYENMLYTMSLTGQEVHDALEMSYALWTNQMTSPADHLLLLGQTTKKGSDELARFRNPSYNFDSAAGIIYEVDVRKPAGQKVNIISMADGTPFSLDKTYRVAVNSYRGNGGGELLTKGAGIPREKLTERILSSTDKDLRFYLMQYIEQMEEVHPKPLNQWKFIPTSWYSAAAKRDSLLIFGEK
ncbi:MAG: bifunctional metallophosphatase/5'-nucleotidase [Bacteroides sp.]|nr:bifunctional metallophosphatase/5'-nucleotidase [Bacteroides sp.]